MTAEDKEDDSLFVISPPEDIRPKFPYMEDLIKVSSIINMWPKSKKTNSVLYHTKVLIILFLCVTLTLSFGIQIINEFRNLDSVAALIDFATVCISAVFRYVYIYVRGDSLLHMVSLIHNNFIHYPIIPSSRGSSLYKQYNFAKKLILVYSIFTFCWLLQMCTIPIVGYVWAIVNLSPKSNETVPYPMLYDGYIPFEYQKQPPSVIAVYYTYQAITFLTFGWIYVAVDSFWYMVILLTIGQFALIEDSLNTMTEVLKKAEERGHSLKERQIRKVECGLKRCVAQHQFAKRFVRMIDNLCNPIILVDSMHAMISIGFIILDLTISINSRTWNKALYSLQYLVASIVHLFLYDWMGNELAEKENELGNTIYNFPWYKFPSQKTTFLLITANARNHSKLTGGKMFNLNLQYFAKTIRAVFSYSTFLFQVGHEK